MPPPTRAPLEDPRPLTSPLQPLGHVSNMRQWRKEGVGAPRSPVVGKIKDTYRKRVPLARGWGGTDGRTGGRTDGRKSPRRRFRAGRSRPPPASMVTKGPPPPLGNPRSADRGLGPRGLPPPPAARARGHGPGARPRSSAGTRRAPPAISFSGGARSGGSDPLPQLPPTLQEKGPSPPPCPTTPPGGRGRTLTTPCAPPRPLVGGDGTPPPSPHPTTPPGGRARTLTTPRRAPPRPLVGRTRPLTLRALSRVASLPSGPAMAVSPLVALMLLYLPLSNTTRLGGRIPRSFGKSGDLRIGGVFPITDTDSQPAVAFASRPPARSCELFSSTIYRVVQGFLYAVEGVNGDPHLLSNLTLGFSVWDSCALVSEALLGVAELLTGRGEPTPNYRCGVPSPVVAFVGEDRSTLSIAMATWLGLYKVPQISYASTVPTLSDRSRFPSFLRALPPDGLRTSALAQLAIRLGWTWVGIFADDDDYGLQGGWGLRAELEAAGVCVAFFAELPTTRRPEKIRRLKDEIRRLTARALLVVSSDIDYLRAALDMILKEEGRGSRLVGTAWAHSDSWSSTDMFSFSAGPINWILQGSLALSTHVDEIPGFLEFLNRLHPAGNPEDIFLRSFWAETFGCRWASPGPENETLPSEGSEAETAHFAVGNSSIRVCTGSENLRGLPIPFLDLRDSSATFRAYEAVQSIARALRALSLCQPPEGPFADGACAKIGDFKPWQTPRSVCSESCRPGSVRTPRQGQPPCCFDCAPCSEGEMANQSDALTCQRCPDDESWPNEAKDRCVMKAVEHLSYSDPLGTALASSTVAAALLPAVILGLFFRFSHTPVVRANRLDLSNVLLGSLLLCDLGCLLFLTPPTRLTCLLRQAAFGVPFATGVSCVLAKTVVVVVAFRATVPGSVLQGWLKPWLPQAIVAVGALIQAVICASWMVLAPAFPERDTRSSPGKVLLVCNEGSPVAFWCVLGYLCLLASASFVLAFLARRLPDGFNEAKFITFSMVVFVSVWGAFLPAHLSTRGRAAVAVEVFSILCSSSGLLGCIFFPKCYILLLRPDRNTREALLGRRTPARKKQISPKTVAGPSHAQILEAGLPSGRRSLWEFRGMMKRPSSPPTLNPDSPSSK
ncbi:vomeronasal type-2 receptor 26-like [Tachyglossus aculeatus]|uniref:vomeronasal type-2 receptor 26-like n=1 Tax=Tachyglossus aculeatus TaxID=9261 RepID=UPI0018F7535E|nr:vomeronasal type-2 receptor 26-like [Tachyglossus aculeatus]